MIQTSYFRAPGLPLDRCCAISLTVPPCYHGRRYPDLAPSRELLNNYQSRKWDWELYTTYYRAWVLDRLDPMEVGSDLTQEGDVILLCWEKWVPGLKCHRRLVAEWLAFIESVPEWAAPGATVR